MMMTLVASVATRLTLPASSSLWVKLQKVIRVSRCCGRINRRLWKCTLVLCSAPMSCWIHE